MHHQLKLIPDGNIALATFAGADEAITAGSALVAKQPGSEQSSMLRLDDELAGLIEAANMPADEDRAHPTKPVSPLSGELPGVQSRLSAAILADVTMAIAVQ